MSISNDFQTALDKLVAALSRLLEGNPEPLNALWSKAEDVTVFGGFGGYARGWEQVTQNTAFAASRLHGGQNMHVETLASGVSGDLAYVVWFERGEVHVPGRDDYVPLVVRVTHIFQRENGDWRLIHRHGDQVVEKSGAPPAQPT